MSDTDNIRKFEQLVEKYRAKGIKVKTAKIRVPELPKGERDRILGAYMDAISTLESVIELLFWTLLQTDLATAKCVFSKLGFRQIDELLQALGRFSLSQNDQRNLDRLCRRLRKAVSKRNRIIHGHWSTHIISVNDEDPPLAEAKWLRMFTATDSETEQEIKTDPKVWGKYRFDLKALVRAGNVALTLAKDFSDFRASLTYVPEPPLGRESPRPPEEPPNKDQ